MPMKKASIKKNFAYQMIYEILVLILPLVLSPYVSRVIGAEGLGIYSYSYSVAYYFVLFSMLGIKNYGNRVIAKARDNQDELNEAFSSLVIIHIFVSAVCIVGYLIYITFLSHDDKLYAVIQLLFVISALFDISWFYFGIEEFKLTVIRNVAVKIVTVIAVFALVRTDKDLWIYCLIMSLGFLISQLILWVPLGRYVKIVKPLAIHVKTHIKPLLILFIPAIAVSLYKYMDKIMIGLLSNKSQLGFYENAEKVVNVPLTVIVSFGTVMLPKMSNLAARKNDVEEKRYISLSMDFVMCLAYALSFGLAGVGKVFAPIFWGAEFTPSGQLIMGLSMTIPFISFANVIRTQYLIPHEKDTEYVISVVIGAIINLIINWLLIPHMGATGAMIGTIAAEIAVCVVQCFVVRREITVISYILKTVPFFIIGLIMFVIIYLYGLHSNANILTLFIQVAFGMVFYLLIAFAVFMKQKNDLIINYYTKFKYKITGFK